MKAIDTYLEKYGSYTILEEKLNEVDCLFFALISYVNFTGIVEEGKKSKILLKNAVERFFSKYTKTDIRNNILSVRNAISLLKKLSLFPRYQNLYLYNYHYKVSNDMQFGAICILLPTKEVFVSFEGTDSYISGWKEDFMLAYRFPTDAQREAINYLNKVTGFIGPKIYVGGHSKGGNLALVSSMYCNSLVRHKIKKVLNYDGPGLRKTEFDSKEYKKIFSKYSSYVPESSLVGMLLNHSNHYIVVESSNKGIMQHDATSWIINEDSFKRTEISSFSKKIESGVLRFLDKLEDKQREKFVNSFFNILKKAEVNDLNQFKKTKLTSMMKILKETKNLNKDTKKMMMDCFKGLYEEIK